MTGVRRVPVSWKVLLGLALAGVAAWLITRANPVAVALAVLVGWAIWRVGFMMLRSMAIPLAEPPPPGELRSVRITYRCTICGTEVRMTTANDEIPDPPRHCQEDMELVAPIE